MSIFMRLLQRHWINYARMTTRGQRAVDYTIVSTVKLGVEHPALRGRLNFLHLEDVPDHPGALGVENVAVYFNLNVACE